MKGIYEVTVESGRNIKEVITDYVLKMGWEEVYISGAIGSVTEMAYTTPVKHELPLQTVSLSVNGAAEVVSFTGEIMKKERMDPMLKSVYAGGDNPLFVHIHVSCAYKDGVKGGGLSEGKAFRALRVFMFPLTPKELEPQAHTEHHRGGTML